MVSMPDTAAFSRMMHEQNKPDFEIRGTKFHVSRLAPMDGYRLLDSLRASIGASYGGLTSIATATNASDMVIGSFLSLPPAVIEDAANRMWAHVTFTNASALDPLPLRGNEQMAFEQMQPTDIYEVILRCFAVNFIESLEELFSRIQGEPPTSSSPST